MSDGTWLYSRRVRLEDPAQGWKIHLSATPASAPEVLSRAFPVLEARDILFKVPLRMKFLAELNVGLPHFSQIGKFLTAYPRSAEEAVGLASSLRVATRDLKGPVIPFDKRYRGDGIVYYRYGALVALGRRTSDRIIDPAGRKHRDKRAAGAAVPPWQVDPFQQSRGTRRISRGPIGRDYLAFKAIAQRGKGGVYEALDLSVSPARLVILKEGRCCGETDLTGRDGYSRVKHEARLLRILRRRALPVPEVLAEFTQSGNRYLVLEKIPGRPLLARNRMQPTRPSWRRGQRILQQIEFILARMHAAGWVWRDCKPSHIFMHRGAMRLIDFEGACRIDDTQALPWSSPNYVPPSCERRLSRRVGTLEDDYALGVIVFQFTTGKFPPADDRGRARCYKRARCPDSLRARIEELLQGAAPCSLV